MITLTAPEGREYYRINNPGVYGTQITLGPFDTEENWILREETTAETEGEGYES